MTVKTAAPITLFEAGIDNYLDAVSRQNENGQTVKEQRVVTEDQTGDTSEVLMAWLNFGDNQNRLAYLGINAQGSATGDQNWTIRKFDWAAGPVAGDFVPTRIQVLQGAWDSRAILPWVP